MTFCEIDLTSGAVSDRRVSGLPAEVNVQHGLGFGGPPPHGLFGAKSAC